MKHLMPTITVLMGIMFFFIGTSYVQIKNEDKTWADKGTTVTSYILSVLLIIYGISGFFNKEK